MVVVGRTSAALAAALRASPSPSALLPPPPKTLPPDGCRWEVLVFRIRGVLELAGVGFVGFVDAACDPKTRPGCANGSGRFDDLEQIFPIVVI